MEKKICVDKKIGISIGLYSDMLANNLADELEVHEHLFEPRDQFVKEKGKEYAESFLSHFLEKKRMFIRVSQILKPELQTLSQVKKEEYQKEFDGSLKTLISLEKKPNFLKENLHLLDADTIQELVSFSTDNTLSGVPMSLIYSVEI